MNRVFQIQVRSDFRKSQLTPAGSDGTATLRQGDATASQASLNTLLTANQKDGRWGWGMSYGSLALTQAINLSRPSEG